ncbi:probable cysteine--tRNA ligase, mitochondrial isoform X2 [Odontomachus brunneus]|uniref:probable cysteine--tRNA ligase, mitochondrial isoform X2 n=1 Tax=Odontomachus brunneus TaxID=486640 RepID=UPI0013F2AED1|nr:probable cysteine--tRNA ligase, mitochondrial isoform X2 [Odontomachus brunneus]
MFYNDTYIKSDIIRRILTDYFNIDVLLVMGITNIDDKIIKRSIEMKQDFKTLSNHFEMGFLEDMNKLNVRKPYMYCRVTDYVPQIINFVEKLIADGYGYITKDGSVYFDTSKYNRYGKLSTPLPDTAHPDKKSALDFALWKAAKENEPSWQCPWGYGRPGWHIECSVIASAVLGNSIDMHSGGIDLAFPHHENEEAQSCCYHGIDQWVNYWLHCGHLHLKGDVKMSKSLRNTVNIRDYLEKYSANHLRMLCLLSHYRNGLEFTDEIMQNAVSVTKKIENFVSDCNTYVVGKLQTGKIDENLLLTTLQNTKNQITTALADDFDTARAMHAILDLVRIGNKMLGQNDVSSSNNVNDSHASAVAVVSNYVSSTLSKLGLSQYTISTKDRRIEDIIEYFLKFRTAVRNMALENPKNNVLMKKCDNAREELFTCGVLVKDHKNSSTWRWK